MSSNQLFAILLSQHRFHLIQAINGGAHLRLTNDALGLRIGDLFPKIHFQLSLLLSDNGLNGRRCLSWGDVSLP